MRFAHPDMCGHRNKIIICKEHFWSCSDCGFGVGQQPMCKCNEKSDPSFGTHIREAIAIVRDWKNSRFPEGSEI